MDIQSKKFIADIRRSGWKKLNGSDLSEKQQLKKC